MIVYCPLNSSVRLSQSYKLLQPLCWNSSLRCPCFRLHSSRELASSNLWQLNWGKTLYHIVTEGYPGRPLSSSKIAWSAYMRCRRWGGCYTVTQHDGGVVTYFSQFNEIIFWYVHWNLMIVAGYWIWTWASQYSAFSDRFCRLVVWVFLMK
jgi:hypothetical protein